MRELKDNPQANMEYLRMLKLDKEYFDKGVIRSEKLGSTTI